MQWSDHVDLGRYVTANRRAGDVSDVSSARFKEAFGPPSLVPAAGTASSDAMMCSDVVMRDIIAARTAATTALDDEDEERQLCVICLEAVTDDATFLSCAHVYHGACISRWLQRAPRCPQCGVAAGPLAAGSLDVRLQSAESQLLAVRRTASTLPPPRSPLVRPRASPCVIALGPVTRGAAPPHTIPPAHAMSCVSPRPHVQPHVPHNPAASTCQPMRRRGPFPGAAHQSARRAAPARSARAARLRRRARPKGVRAA